MIFIAAKKIISLVTLNESNSDTHYGSAWTITSGFLFSLQYKASVKSCNFFPTAASIALQDKLK